VDLGLWPVDQAAFQNVVGSTGAGQKIFTVDISGVFFGFALASMALQAGSGCQLCNALAS
jgi:hypothetical protein